MLNKVKAQNAIIGFVTQAKIIIMLIDRYIASKE